MSWQPLAMVSAHMFVNENVYMQLCVCTCAIIIKTKHSFAQLSSKKLKNLLLCFTLIYFPGYIYAAQLLSIVLCYSYEEKNGKGSFKKVLFFH